jgi:hypothetical protein
MVQSASGSPKGEARGSKSAQAMEARLDTLSPGTPRHNVLRTAIDFKRSWLQLAKSLSEIEKNKDYKEWGYRTLTAYTQHELFLRKETVVKLLRSFQFLESHERRFLEEKAPAENVVPLPSFQALDVLAEARENPYLSESDFRDLRNQVFEEDPSPGQIRKLVRERAPEPVKKSSLDPQARLRKCMVLAERLYGLLLETEEVPAEIPEKLESVVGGLKRLLGEE